MPPIYAFNEETGLHSLTFSLTISANQSDGAFSYTFAEGWGKVQIHGLKTGDTLVFSIKLIAEENKYSVFKSCSARIRDAQWLAFNTIKIWPNTVNQQYLTTLHPYQFKTNDEPFILQLTLLSMEVNVPPTDQADPDPTLGEIILENLYKDQANEDVFFIFDSMSNVPTTPGELDIRSSVTSDSSTDTAVSIEDEHDPYMDWLKSYEDNDRPKADADCSQDSNIVTIGAHKLVLYQWSHFKAMLEGKLTAGGPNNPIIQINEASPKAFLMLLRFMYTGRLPKDVEPTTVYMNPLNKYVDESWESLYLLAERYKIEELIDIARASILSKFSAEETVPFLFRTAYMFKDLREPVIKFMVESCGSIIASKTTRQEYMGHPDGVQIFGELFEQLYAAQK